MLIKDGLNRAQRVLKDSIERPRLEAEILLAYHLGCDRTTLLLRDQEELRDEAKFFELIKRRLAHEPIEYITNEVSFYGERFYIAPGALIPRPETELLVDRAASLIKKLNIGQIAEIGVGSAAVSVMLAKFFTDLRIVASDISKEALKIAHINVKRFGMDDRIKLVQTSLLDGIGKVEMIISNPPYIAKGCKLEANVADYEPAEALFAEDEGTSILKQIIILSKERRVPLICEMGYDQRKPIERFFKELGIKHYSFYKDLAGLDRGFIIDPCATLKI